MSQLKMAPNGPQGYYKPVEQIVLSVNDITPHDVRQAELITESSYSMAHPIAVEKGQMGKFDVIDGFHRLHEFLEEGIEEFAAIVFEAI